MSKMDEQPTQKGSVLYVASLILVAALGGLLFGYYTAVISGAIGFLRTKFELSAMMTGWSASAALTGCIVGAAFAGFLSDRFGRKKSDVVLCGLFLYLDGLVGNSVRAV